MRTYFPETPIVYSRDLEEFRRLERAKTSAKILAPFRSMSKGDKDFGSRGELCDDRLPP